MNTRSFGLIASIAWAGVAVSNAAPAHALAATGLGQEASYANCSADSESYSVQLCDYWFYYQQTIKFVGAPCNGGACDPDPGGVITDMVYATGRKEATLVAQCTWLNLEAYELGSCAC
jgi:hypothetical protein